MEFFIGQIIMFAGNFAIRNFAQCDGQLLPISQYSALFSILGTTYGGDGRTTFALPDLRGRVPVHHGQGAGLSNYRLGQRAGVENVTLTVANMPNHDHNVAVGVTDEDGTTNEANGNILANTANNNYSTSGVAADQILGGVTETSAGGNTSFGIIQPYLTINYLICLNGIFPSRS